ncbi:MAG: hypothetical protein H0V09_02290, partial [Gemmatimonadetes bacterium]|nr:hypothetical protein [Gemmatimonadota bacterium]
FLDRSFLDPLREGDGASRALVPAAAEALLFVELEGKDERSAAAAAARALDLLSGSALPGSRLAVDAAETAALWSLRRGASPSLSRRHPRLASFQFVEDCAVPPVKLAELLQGLRGIFEKEGVPAVLFGHAGEAHVHANPLLDPSDPRLGERIDRIASEVCELVDRLGGTLSGEHGDGLARAEFATRRFGASADTFQRIRDVCDPDGILNPGIVLPAPSWRTGRSLRHPWERRALAARARWRTGRGAATR